MRYFILTLVFFCFISAAAQENRKYINVNGTAELILKADQINFKIQIKIVNESVEESKKVNNKQLNKLLKILKSIGIDSNDIEISPIVLGKNYEYIYREKIQKGFYSIDSNDIEILPIVLGKNYEYIFRERKQKGFYTEINVTFLLNDLSKYYELINRLSTNNYFEILSSNYSISDYEHQNELANEKALKAAKEKAEYLVKTLGLNLGEILEIEENNYWQRYSLESNAITTETSQNNNVNGIVTIRRSVRVKFAIK